MDRLFSSFHFDTYFPPSIPHIYSYEITNMKNILLFSLLIVAMQGYAQNDLAQAEAMPTSSKGNQYALKLGNVSTFRKDAYYASEGAAFTWPGDKKGHFKAIEMRPSFQIIKDNQNIHEFSINELRRLTVDQYLQEPNGLTPYKFRIDKLELGYVYFLKIFQKYQWDRVSIYSGFELAPYVHRFYSESSSGTIFARNGNEIGLHARIIPRLAYKLSENFFADLSLPITLLELNYNHVQYNSPTVPINERVVNTVNSSTPAASALAVGIAVGYKF